jgi:heptosyltransferase II
MNIQLLKNLDSIIGFISAATFPAPVHRECPTPVTSLLIIRPGGIGDAVLLAPAIRALKSNNPQAHITILAELRNAGVFPLIPGVDIILCYDRPREFIQSLCGRYDVVIDTEQYHRLSAIVARIVRAPVKIGFDTNERRRMFTHTVPYSHDDYEADSFAHLLVLLGIETGCVEMGAPFLSLPDAASGNTAGLLESLHDEPFVVIFPGASISERQWGAERFCEVTKRLAEKDYRIVVVGGREDRSEGELITGEGGLNLAGMTTLAETAAVIARSRLVISGDSGILHVAVGLDIPTVSLFGPGLAAKWTPRGEKHIVLNRQLACSPCTRFGTTPPCPHGVRCMNEITVDQVMDAAVRLLRKI